MPIYEASDIRRVVTVTPTREEARLRLTCAALTGTLSHPETGIQKDATVASYAVNAADACLALLYPEVPK